MRLAVEHTHELTGTKLLREVEEWERGRQIAAERQQRSEIEAIEPPRT